MFAPLHARRGARVSRRRRLQLEVFETRRLLTAEFSGANDDGHGQDGDPAEVGQLFGAVWNDRNGNGQREDGEPGLAGWRVLLDPELNTPANHVQHVAVTNADGFYHFEEVAAGEHLVTLAPRDGWALTAPESESYIVNLNAGEVIDGLRFGVQALEVGAVAGMVWNDLDSDGQRDDGEPPLPHWPVYLDAGDVHILGPNGGIIQPGNLAFTNEDGIYLFEGVAAGDHVVTIGARDGWTVTFPASGAYEVHVEADQVIEGLHFGLRGPEVGQIAGVVWSDHNGDGRRDDGEPPLAQWPVFLDDGQIDRWDPAGMADRPVRLAVTDEHGRYHFEEVLVGDHVIQVGNERGWTVTSPDSGLYAITVEPNQIVEGLDFGLHGPEVGQLIGLVWNDLDGDGRRDDGEPPLVNWPVFLDDLFLGPAGSNAPIPRPRHVAVTNENGFYRFEEVAAGEHVVTVGQGEGDWTITAPEDGFYNVSLGADETIDGLVFGLRQTERADPGWILGEAWNDLDGDGVWDREEPPLVEWRIFLDANGNGEHDDDERSVRTSEHGGYAIQVEPGEYHVGQVLPDRWEATFPGEATQLVTVAAGEVVDGVRFGARLVVTLESPEARNDHAETQQDVPEEIAVLENDFPGPDGAWSTDTLTIVEPPEHGSVHISLPLGVITYVPERSFFGRDAFVYTIATEEGVVSNRATVVIEVGARERPWQNPRMRWDVDASGGVSLRDALEEVNELRNGGIRTLPALDPKVAEGEAPPAVAAASMFLDVNGDNMISVADLLDVVVHLRDADSAMPPGEGETGSSLSAVAAPQFVLNANPSQSASLTASHDDTPAEFLPPVSSLVATDARRRIFAATEDVSTCALQFAAAADPTTVGALEEAIDSIAAERTA
jgi:hypothetical protein